MGLDHPTTIGVQLDFVFFLITCELAHSYRMLQVVLHDEL